MRHLLSAPNLESEHYFLKNLGRRDWCRTEKFSSKKFSCFSKENASVYLIPFAPHAFVSQRQNWTKKLPSPLVFLSRSTHFTATPRIPLLSSNLYHISFHCIFSVRPRDLTTDLICRLHTLYAQSFRITLAPLVLPRLLARNLPVLSLMVPSSPIDISNRYFFPLNRSLQSEDLHPSRGVAASGFRPLRNIPHCCLP